jgi:hypothetical protein
MGSEKEQWEGLVRPPKEEPVRDTHLPQRAEDRTGQGNKPARARLTDVQLKR